MVELDVDLGALFGGAANSPDPNIVRLESQKLHWLRRQLQACSALQDAIDKLGSLSAEAQSLKRPVTSFKRFADAMDDQALYLLWEPASASSTDSTTSAAAASKILGFVKVVRDRRLYLVDVQGRRFVTTPLCVLDFFVHQSMQHQGKGVHLFNAMLEAEALSGSAAHRCAFDKPSEPLLQFLSHHFGLVEPVWQPTNIVVFPPFFEGLEPEKASKTAAAEDGDAQLQQRPLTALERHRQSVNERYNGTAPSSTPRPAQLDQAGAIIHQSGPAPVRVQAGPDTPQGRKARRDYGHQRIW